MAGGDSQKQLLTLIRDFATEKSQGEFRVAGLKKKIEELRSELDNENAELEDGKRFKETTEQELKGFEVELALNEASIQALEARISLIQQEVSKIGSDLEALKTDEGVSRDEFISQMLEFNKKLRTFHKMIARTSLKDNCIEILSSHGHKLEKKQAMPDTEIALRGFEDKLAQIISQTNMEEQEYQEEQNIHKKVQQELVDLERHVSLTEIVVEEMKELQNVTRQIALLEESCASLGKELQRRCTCPSCHLENVEALGGILQANERD